MNSRAVAASVINSVVSQKKSLADLLPKVLEKTEDAKTKSFVKELCYGSLRHYLELDAIAKQLLHEPMKSKNWDIYCLLLVGIYQIHYLRTPHYAAVSETVNATRVLKKKWAASLLNKTLRRFIEQEEEMLAQVKSNANAMSSHSSWMLESFQQDWPNTWQEIVNANNHKAPLYVRINNTQISTEDYAKKLKAAQIDFAFVESVPSAIMIEKPLPVLDLPGFHEGWFYVQDISGQLAVSLLDLNKNADVLDCCAAPGSKTTHMLETEPKLHSLVAIDNQANRLPKIRQNLQRLKLPHDHLYLTLADASHVDQWWNGEKFDRILIDAPCSATGVIRRHPDIKWLREAKDVDNLVQVQAQLLHKLWPLIKPKGKLLYSTCSVLKAENVNQAKRFLAQHKDAKSVKINLPFGQEQEIGWQILPEPNGPDGFYYALFEKK